MVEKFLMRLCKHASNGSRTNKFPETFLPKQGSNAS
jgi:hypothetical protein